MEKTIKNKAEKLQKKLSNLQIKNKFIILALLLIPLISMAEQKKVEAPKKQIETPKMQRLPLKPEYNSSKSFTEEPIQVQKDLPIPSRSGNIYSIQKRVLKEVGASENQIKQATEGAAEEPHSMD